MVNKNKHPQSIQEKLEIGAAHLGMAVVAMATVVNMAELSERGEHKFHTPAQTAYAHATEPSKSNAGETEYRRGGGEKIRHGSASYNIIQLSAFTAGSQ